MSPTLQADSLPSEPSITSMLPTLLETWLSSICTCLMASQMAQVVKNPPAMQETESAGLIPGLGRSPGEENSEPLRYSCLENPMDREA